MSMTMTTTTMSKSSSLRAALPTISTTTNTTKSLAVPTSSTTISTFNSTSVSAVKPTTSTSMATLAVPAAATPTRSRVRVRFDAECILIPDTGAGRPKFTKSYSLPLWRRGGKEKEKGGREGEDVVLKVVMPSVSWPQFFRALSIPRDA
ncbi:hypothetical protein C8R43DRAFT_150527 [Mycena crocata]|nr:hypothetical protein C8R43DRAFT_150527 [Mycena crocata]